jgi:hypothetical protein
MASMLKVSSIKKLFWNDEHWIQPTVSGENYRLKSFFRFRCRFVRSKINNLSPKHLRPEQKI